MIGTQKISFTSYLNKKMIEVKESNVNFDHKLLSGEVATASSDVYMYVPNDKLSDEVMGRYGKLFVTNFRLSFLPFDLEYKDNSGQKNRFLGTNDVSLNSIDIIYQIVDKKKKRLLPQQKVISRIDALFIICKNFRFLKFGFNTKDGGTLIASALARFAYPPRQDLSFAFYYNDKCRSTPKSDVKMFNTKNDWIGELKRCRAMEWKVVSPEYAELNETKQLICNSQTIKNFRCFPKYFVIPKCFDEKEFFLTANLFYNSRSAFWVYSFAPTGAAMVRMGELRSQRQSRTVENVTLEKVRNCDPDKKSLQFKNLADQSLPTIYEVRQSYLKLRQLCIPDNIADFLVQDSKYYSLLDKSGWLKCVSSCLKFAVDISEFLREGITVVLQENNARDMCCVISSITQVLLDPYFRTINGFQSLIQKEWIALGHPFCDRLGHTWKHESSARPTNNIGNNPTVNNKISNNNFAEQESPLFLLFLDCVWQILQQYSDEFEFSETYLTTLWDSVFMPIFDTFQFNNERERHEAAMEKKIVLRSVWEWQEQFDENDRNLFYNPLYLNSSIFSFDKKNVDNHKEDSIELERIKCAITNLNPLYSISDLQIWHQCYYRWIPHLEINGGGFTQIDLLHRVLVMNISKLRKEIAKEIFSELLIPHNNSEASEKNETKSIEKENFDLKRTEAYTLLKSDCIISKQNSFFPFSSSEIYSSDIKRIPQLKKKHYSSD